jgi:hypothetical protein
MAFHHSAALLLAAPGLLVPRPLFAPGPASAGVAPPSARTGTVIVRVVVEGAAAPVPLTFTGTPSGSASPGQDLTVAGLEPGQYVTTQAAPVPPLILASVTCDDADGDSPSVGDVSTRRATFDLEDGETVTCTFVNRAEQTGQESEGVTPSSPGGTPDDSGVNPFDVPDDDMDDFPLPDDLPPEAGTALVPRAGPWNVDNHLGSMNCGVFNAPLQPGSDQGVLQVLDGGDRLLAEAMAADEADVPFQRIEGIAGRYYGSVGGEFEEIPMVIHFYMQVVTDTYMVGFLRSEHSEQGMTCRMYRPFDLRYAG